MGIRLDRPLYTVTTHDQNLQAQNIWEGESLGGIKVAQDRSATGRP